MGHFRRMLEMQRLDLRVLILTIVCGTMGCSARTESDSPAAQGPKELRDLPKETEELLDTLGTADSFVLLALDGDIPFRERGIERENAFRGWPILGETEVSDPAVRQSLLNALANGVRENVNDMAASCFNPRHGIKALVDGQRVDLVICFECFQAQVHSDIKHFEGFLLTNSPQKTFDEVLRKAGVKLASRTR
jgi:hypothetical protein